MFPFLILLATLLPSAAVPLPPFSTSGSKILDASGSQIQFRCVNWPGHMEANLPEGLQFQPLHVIVNTLAAEPTYNCVRLTYAVELFSKQAMTARESFSAGNNNASVNLAPHIANFSAHNPHLIDLTLPQVFEAVVDALGKKGIFVLMSNHVSKAGWCCGIDDGNGWWGDEFFDAKAWLQSLEQMATLMRRHDNVVAMDLRNELRCSGMPFEEQIRGWMTHMPMGIEAIRRSDPSMLIFVSGVLFDNDLTFLAFEALASAGWARQLTALRSKIVFEGHIYSWSPFGKITDDCNALRYEEMLGWPWYNNHPLVLSEIGCPIDTYPTSDHHWFEGCVASLIVKHRLGYGMWLLGGSYYVRDGKLNAPDSFGLLTAEWSRFKNAAVIDANKKMDWTRQDRVRGLGTADDKPSALEIRGDPFLA